MLNAIEQSDIRRYQELVLQSRLRISLIFDWRHHYRTDCLLAEAVRLICHD